MTMGWRGVRLSQRRAAPYVFIAPFYVIYVLFFLVPVGFALYLSVSEWSGIGQPKFVGLKNYAQMFLAGGFDQVVVQSLWYLVGCIFTIIPFAFTLALMLNTRWNRLQNSFRVLYFLPAVTSAIVIGINFSYIYHLRYGLLNWALTTVGLPPVEWLGSPEWFKPAVLLMIMWRWVGYNAIYFLAGLQDLPGELYEAAEIDGASWFQRLLWITIPLLRPVFLFVLIIEVISDLQLFEDVYILDPAGGPGESGMTIAMYLYRSGFIYGDLGYAAAIGVVLALVIFVIALAQAKLLGLFRDN